MTHPKSRHGVSSSKPGKGALAAALEAARRHYAEGNLDQVILNLRQVLAISPRHAIALDMREEIEAEFCQSEDYFRSEFITRQQDPALHRAYANFLLRLNRLEESLSHYRQAIGLDAGNARGHYGLGRAYSALGDPERARVCFRAALERKPDYVDAKYFLAGLGEERRFGKDKLQYVGRLFDMAADTFDRHLQEDLGYRIPTLIRTAMEKVVAPATRGLDILDLGCGTGLSGIPFKEWARTLTGVDLSPGMLAKARERGIYDALIQAELTGFLDNNASAYDLVVATDVFIYVGDLQGVFPAIAAALRNDGHFAFSVESCKGDGYVIRSSARYAHSGPYLSELAQRHGFTVVLREDVEVRKENTGPIPGEILILQKNA